MAHLLRRAGFGATPAELDEYLALGFDGAVDRLVHPEEVEEADFTLEVETAEQLVKRGTLQAVWTARMVQTRRPLLEKMTLFWHGHFATSLQKVKSVTVMSEQIDTFRTLAFGRFEDLLLAVIQDPAMLVWLDNVRSKSEAPNENLGRELLELFTLGVGNYTEDDVKAASRALTGYSVLLARGEQVGDDDTMAADLMEGDTEAAKREQRLDRRTRAAEFSFRDRWHDDGEKTFLGETGAWDGADIVRIVSAHPACARFIAGKLFAFFAWDKPDDATVAPFAGVFMASGGDLRETVGAILRSPEFSSEEAYRAKVKSPIEFVASLIRELGGQEAPGGAIAAMSAMGQTLYAPPNVGGWPSGLGWIGPSTLLERYNVTNDLFGTAAAARTKGQTAALDPAALLTDLRKQTPAALVALVVDRLLSGDIEDGQRETLTAYLAQTPAGDPLSFDPADPVFAGKLRGLIRLITTIPAYQLN
jgi:uncharacterized protein (DUF1800 family)